MTRRAVIVTPLSTGREYADAFRRAGVLPVAVLNGTERSPALQASWHPEKYESVLHQGDFPDIAALAAAVARLDPLCIVPGAEVGVELWEQLVGLVLPDSGNVRGLGDARRDKWAMAKALEDAGLPALRQLCSADPVRISHWIASEGLGEKALVIKPPKSGGTDDVHLISPGTDWRPIVAGILGKVNATGIVNEAVLVQEFADGPEFLVDSYSVDGRHGLVDVCRYTKYRRGDRIGVYDRVDFLPPDDPDVRQVWPYVQDVLNAVGVRNGCGHSEVVLTADGPRLLEVAERPAGGGHQMISELATGDNHIHRTVAHRVRGEFRESYELKQYVRGIFLSAPVAGVVADIEALRGADALPTFYAKHLPYRAGEPVPETVDLLSVLGWVVLTGDDPAAIERDYGRVKQMEQQVRIAEPVLVS